MRVFEEIKKGKNRYALQPFITLNFKKELYFSYEFLEKYNMTKYKGYKLFFCEEDLTLKILFTNHHRAYLLAMNGGSSIGRVVRLWKLLRLYKLCFKKPPEKNNPFIYLPEEVEETKLGEEDVVVVYIKLSRPEIGSSLARGIKS